MQVNLEKDAPRNNKYNEYSSLSHGLLSRIADISFGIYRCHLRFFYTSLFFHL